MVGLSWYPLDVNSFLRLELLLPPALLAGPQCKRLLDLLSDPDAAGHIYDGILSDELYSE